jgi:YidC/Oxa1 family membrane protein insertase
MEKKTLIAIALSMVVIGAGLFIQWKFFPSVPNQEKQAQSQQVVEKEEPVKINDSAPSDWVFNPAADEGNRTVSGDIKAETDLVEVVFSGQGGFIKSYKLKKHKEKNGLPVEMILDEGQKQGAFNITFGNGQNTFNRDPFSLNHVAGTDIYEFYRDYSAENKNTGETINFRLSKEYKFFPDEYLFELTITLKSVDGKSLPFSKGQALYTLQFGPQLGPEFGKLTKNKNQTGEHRNFIIFGLNQKKKTISIPKKEQKKTITDRISWAAINGKYFSVVVMPGSADYLYTFSKEPVNGNNNSNQMFLSRMPETVAMVSDKYRIYIGPNLKKEMSRYNSAESNASGLMETGMDKLVEGGFLGWLEFLLMKLLVLFYKLVPNYGIAIILLTVFIKIILFPFTWKSFESTSKMQTIQPKVQELQAKYKEDPARMNKEMADLYKREGVNPMGGCLPQLLQMPVLIALYGLLNRYFDLRGAMFIPGWIEDLSSPESVYSMGFTLPLVDISELRILPIVYLIIQLLTSLVMQGTSPTPGSSNAQMKMMTYGMPIIFFFLFYNMPSGLLLYWTMTNVLTLAQQLITSRIKKLKQS